MTRYLIAATPVHGHVMPMLAIAKGLTGRGHEVRVLTGSRFAGAAAAAGADHVPFPPPADYDDRDPDAAFPQRRKTDRAGPPALRHGQHLHQSRSRAGRSTDGAARRPGRTRSSPTPRFSARSPCSSGRGRTGPRLVCGVFPCRVEQSGHRTLRARPTPVKHTRGPGTQPVCSTCSLSGWPSPGASGTSNESSAIRPGRAGVCSIWTPSRDWPTASSS